MPRMQGAAVQCCMCIVGVFMFLGGVIMLATGISLILNYGVFDITLLPPDLNNDEGKKTVGIILTVCGLLAITVSVIVSVLYLCHKPKSSINPDDLTRIPTSSRTTPDRTDRRTGHAHHKPHTGGANGVTRKHQPTKNIPGSTEVKLPRAHRKGGRHHGRNRKQQRLARLDEIKEDAISRKTVDAALVDTDRLEDGSYCSETTLDETMPRMPKVVLDDYSDRPASQCSTNTSLFSDTSSNRFAENDKSRRELQFMTDSMRNTYAKQLESVYKDSASMDQFDETSLIGNRYDECSIDSEGISNPVAQEYTMNQELGDCDARRPAGGTGHNGSVQSDVPDTDSSIISYKASHTTKVPGEQSRGRVSPQVDAPETYTDVIATTNEHNHEQAT